MSLPTPRPQRPAPVTPAFSKLLGGRSARPQSAQEGQHDSLASRLVGGRGIKSIAEIAKPSMSTGLARRLITQMPLHASIGSSSRAREDSKRAMAEGDLNLNKMYSRDPEGKFQARALLVGTNKALTRLAAAAEALEAEAVLAHEKLQADHAALSAAKQSSISMLTAEREANLRSLRNEIRHVETDTAFSLQTLSESLQMARSALANQGAALTSERDGIMHSLRQRGLEHSELHYNATNIESRLSTEVARLCLEADGLRSDAERAAAERQEMHASVVTTMSNALAEKQRAIEGKDSRIYELEMQLVGTQTSMDHEVSLAHCSPSAL